MTVSFLPRTFFHTCREIIVVLIVSCKRCFNINYFSLYDSVVLKPEYLKCCGSSVFSNGVTMLTICQSLDGLCCSFSLKCYEVYLVHEYHQIYGVYFKADSHSMVQSHLIFLYKLHLFEN